MYVTAYRFLAILSAAALLAAAGCDGGTYTPARASDPSMARQTLKIALDAWKSGEPAQVLADQKPQLFVGDEDWKGGFELKDYKFIDEGEPFGNNVRFQVGLDLAKSGETVQKSVRYVVATNPVCNVQRDDSVEE